MTATASIRRRRYLGSYFETLATFARNMADKARPSSIALGPHTLSVDPWEWDAVAEWARSPREDGWRFLLVEGLALEARCVSDMERATGGEATTAEGWESVCGDLHFDAILGFKLMAAIQAAVERMVLHGRIDQAKKLTQFRHRMAEAVSSTGSFLGEAKLREAETLASVVSAAPEPVAGEDVADPAPSQDELRALLAMEEKLQKKSELDEARTVAAAAAPRVVIVEATVRHLPPVRTALASALAALILVWLALVAWPALKNNRLRVVTMADFEQAPAVRSVTARPPSLFVSVDDEMWLSLSDEERQTIVERIAGVIEPLGYTGAHFTDARSGVLAQWLRKGGARLTDPRKRSL